MTFSDVSVVVDPESVELINGTEIDFIEGFNQVFKFKNPNAAGECGCGGKFQYLINKDKAMERTLSIIKPDGVEKNIIGKIYSRFEKAGSKIVEAKMLHLSREKAE